MTNVLIDARRGAGSSLEILYGTVTWKPTLTHSRGTSIVLPAPTTFDLVDGQVVATNVQPTPEPVEGQIEWAYEVTFKDRHSKTYSFLVGVPDTTSQVNFISLPRYFESKPPLFGQGPQGVPGEAATVAVGTVTGGSTAQVNNSGTNTDAVLNFVLPKGDKGDIGPSPTDPQVAGYLSEPESESSSALFQAIEDNAATAPGLIAAGEKQRALSPSIHQIRDLAIQDGWWAMWDATDPSKITTDSAGRVLMIKDMLGAGPDMVADSPETAPMLIPAKFGTLAGMSGGALLASFGTAQTPDLTIMALAEVQPDADNQSLFGGDRQAGAGKYPRLQYVASGTRLGNHLSYWTNRYRTVPGVQVAALSITGDGTYTASWRGEEAVTVSGLTSDAGGASYDTLLVGADRYTGSRGLSEMWGSAYGVVLVRHDANPEPIARMRALIESLAGSRKPEVTATAQALESLYTPAGITLTSQISAEQESIRGKVYNITSTWTMDITTTLQGGRVYIEGAAYRTIGDAAGPDVNDVGYVLRPFLPEAVALWPPAGPRLDKFVYLTAVGRNASSVVAYPIVARVSESGYLGFMIDQPTSYFAISGSYPAKFKDHRTAIDDPAFDGTYTRQWWTNHGLIEGEGYVVQHRFGEDDRLAVLAIHAASGEYGSGELAVALAEKTGASIYHVDSDDTMAYVDTHHSSNALDDPRALRLVQKAQRTISLHGAVDRAEFPGAVAFVGGGDALLRQAIIDALTTVGVACVDATEHVPSLAGNEWSNICNQGINRGVQLELSTSLRNALFEGSSASLRTNRASPTPLFHTIVDTLASVTEGFLV